MTIKQLQKDCAMKRSEYQMARQVLTTVAHLPVRDRTALEAELRDAILAYYTAHGHLHARLKGRGESRLH